MMQRLFIALGLLLTLGVAQAQEAAQAFIERFESHQKFHARFVQVLADQDDNVVQRSGGEVWMSYPGKFRWHYEQPFPQQLISNGTNVWIYDPELEQAQVQKLSDLSQSALVRVLSGDKAFINDAFTIEKTDTPDGLRWFKLKSKSAELDIASIMLGFTLTGLSKVELMLASGETHQLSFEQVDLANNFTDEFFEFNPPAGTDVIGQQ